MKTFTFSKKDLDYLQPVDATMNALNVAIQVYVINQVFKRLGLDPTAKARYDLAKGELYIEDEPKQEDLDKTVPIVEQPTVETAEPVEEKK